MNATIIVAASSMVLAIFAVVFFLLQNAADAGMTTAYGEMTIPQEDGSTISAKYAMDGTTKTVSFSAGGYTSMMTEFFDADGSRNIQSYEWDTDGPVLCRFNLERDFER